MTSNDIATNGGSRLENLPECENCGMYIDIREGKQGIVVGCSCHTVVFSDWVVRNDTVRSGNDE